jgi:chromosome segregation ATPase
VEAADCAREWIRRFNASTRSHQAEENRLRREIHSGEKEREALAEELHRLRQELVQLSVLHDTLQQEEADAQSRLAAIRRSIFSRILVKLKIWRCLD